jgi:hypothetical protein
MRAKACSELAALFATLLFATLLFATLLLAPTVARAETPYKRHMVSAGVTPLYLAALHGEHAALRQGEIDELNVGAMGVAISYAYRPLSLLEMRLRGEYLKPLPDRGALKAGLHGFRVVLAPALLVALADWLELAGGFDVGVSLWRLQEGFADELAPGFGVSHAVGWTMSSSLGLRAWATAHTGFWLDASAGYDETRHGGDDLAIRSGWPLKATLGWSDRW